VGGNYAKFWKYKSAMGARVLWGLGVRGGLTGSCADGGGAGAWWRGEEDRLVVAASPSLRPSAERWRLRRGGLWHG
jgi:hypothetical protein